MINNLKYSQLARALNINQAIINMGVTRGHLISDENKLIDTELAHNKLWIEKQITKGRNFDLNRINIKPVPKNKIVSNPKTKKPSSKKQPTNDEITVSDLRALELKKKKADLVKIEKEIKKLDLGNQKLEGKLIPYDAVKKVFLFAAETFRTTYLQEVKSLTTVLINRLGGEHKHFIEVQKELGQKIESIQVETIDNLLTGLNGVVSEYQEVRGRGQSR